MQVMIRNYGKRRQLSGFGVLQLILLLVAMGCPVPAVWGGEMVCGGVFDAADGTPIAGATVTSDTEVVQSNADGSFSIDSSDGRLKLRAPGYRRQETVAEASPEVRLIPFTPRALYLSSYGIASATLRNPALALLEKTELNALVIDIKGDRGFLAHPSAIPLATEIGAQKPVILKNAGPLIASLKEKGIYTIARIVVFKDDLLARAHPEYAIKRGTGEVWQDGEKLGWVDPHLPQVWDYNIAIAEEAARLGFDEIQFDYVRFPAVPGLVFSRENSRVNRVAAISGFLAAARQRLAPYNVFLAADIFGYVCWNSNDTGIGQQLEELAVHLDYLSPMLYPSGFSFGAGGYTNPMENPYEIISLSLEKARERTGLAAVRFRPWLQAFRDYAFDRRHFGAAAIRAQTAASDEFGSNGWMLWNARNVYNGAGLNVVEIEARAEIEALPQPATPPPL
jgi:hypothetical protein